MGNTRCTSGRVGERLGICGLQLEIGGWGAKNSLRQATRLSSPNVLRSDRLYGTDGGITWLAGERHRPENR